MIYQQERSPGASSKIYNTPPLPLYRLILRRSLGILCSIYGAREYVAEVLQNLRRERVHCFRGYVPVLKYYRLETPGTALRAIKMKLNNEIQLTS